MNVNTIKLLGYIQAGSTIAKGIQIVKPEEELHREHYIGASTITHCGLKLWHDYHQDIQLDPEATAISPKTNRIFRLGHILEAELLYLIRLGGGTVEGTQLAFKAFNGKFRGHCDGIIDGSILEIKSMNHDNFLLFQNSDNRAFSVNFPAYYVQVNLYMHYFNKPSGFLLAYNKNTSEVSAKFFLKDKEVIVSYLNKAAALCLSTKIEDIVQYIAADECIWCPYRQHCSYAI